MGEAVFFRNLTTKGLTAVNSGERYFEGYLTVQVKDKQGEVTIVDELMKVLPVWIDRGAPISDTHSNRIIGKGINYSKVEYKDKEGDIYPAIKVTGKIHKNYELDNDIWQKIKSGEYKGLSFGGATKSDREPMRMKDGSIAYSLKDLEHYEVAVCRDPAVPLALITEFNTLAKAAVDGQDLGDGRMLIKCDKFGCYVDKSDKQHQATDVELQQAMGNIKGHTELQNTTRRLGIGRGAARGRKPTTEEPYKGYKTANNGEAGLKAPEASREALVYDDKTLDSVNQTPLENQAKIKKGEADAATDKLIRGVKDPDQRKDLMERQSKQQTAAQDAAVAQSDRADKDTKKGATIVSEHRTGRGKPFCPHCGRDHAKEDEKAVAADKEDPTLMVSGTGGGNKPSCPGCGYRPEEKKKGEDWSNADGDRHSMYNQDTDDGGMGKKHTGPKTCKCGDPKCKDPKCKKHKREVGTGHGSEENNTADGWSGSGSPYPKKKKSDYHLTQEEWEGPKKRKRGKKKKAVITNIHSRLKNLDTLYKKHVANKDPDIEQVSAEHATHNTPTHPKRTYEDQWDETLVIEDDGMGSKEGIPLAEKKIVATLLHTVPANYKKPNKKKKAVITNIHSRLKNLDFMLKKEKKISLHIGEIGGFDAEAYHAHRPERARKYRKERIARQEKEKPDISRELRALKRIQRSEEFGGMNTGEVEHTEPRDTANSRTKRDKDVA